jgi:hypothetical protein
VAALLAPVCLVPLLLTLKDGVSGILSGSLVVSVSRIGLLELNVYKVTVCIKRHAVAVLRIEAITESNDESTGKSATKSGKLEGSNSLTNVTSNVYRTIAIAGKELFLRGRVSGLLSDLVNTVGVVVAKSLESNGNNESILTNNDGVGSLTSIYTSRSGGYIVGVIGLVKSRNGIGLNTNSGMRGSAISALTRDGTLGSSGGSGYDVPSIEAVALSGCALYRTNSVALLVITVVTSSSLKRKLEAGALSVRLVDGGSPSGVNVTRSRNGVGLLVLYLTNSAETNLKGLLLTCTAYIRAGVEALFPLAPGVTKSVGVVAILSSAASAGVGGVTSLSTGGSDSLNESVILVTLNNCLKNAAIYTRIEYDALGINSVLSEYKALISPVVSAVTTGEILTVFTVSAGSTSRTSRTLRTNLALRTLRTLRTLGTASYESSTDHEAHYYNCEQFNNVHVHF